MTDPLYNQLQDSLGSGYRLERELGGGGMSRVFVAEEVRLGRRVVVKLLSPELAAGISAERFQREITLAASLQQANIVQVLSAGEMDGLPFFTMPFVEGESLRSRLAKTPAITVAEVVRILGDVARALQYAHGRGIVHRDIKPDNVLLSGGTAVVTDFGIAKALSASRTAADAPATLTQLGTAIGTPAYMAPEQVAGDPDVDQRVDIYAFGCMAYELLAGHPPFKDRTPQRVLAAHVAEAPRPLHELRPDLPPSLASLVMRCLAKDAADRPQTAGEIVQALDSVPSAGGMTTNGAATGFRKALLTYAACAGGAVVIAKAATVGIGLPDWVVPGAIWVALLGLPAILFTGHYLSWKRARRGGIITLAAFIALVLGFMVTRAMGVGPAASLFARGVIKERDRVIVADFDAPPSDSSLGSVVSEGVRSNLSQSKAIAVVPISQVTAALTRMQKAPTTRVDFATARDMAQREGYKAVVDGKITAVSAGGFILSARLMSAETGDELASFRESARDAGALIPAIDVLTKDLRAKLGESLKSVRAASSLEHATTASLPALRKYTEAMRANNVEQNYLGAIAAFEEAIKLDSTFALAYNGASIAYRNAGLAPERAQLYRDKAFQFRARLPEGDRALIEGVYYTTGPHADRQLAIMAYRRFIEVDSSYSPVYNNLANQYRSERRFAAAESLYKRAVALDSTNAFPRTGLVTSELDLGKTDNAVRAWTEFKKAFPGSPSAVGWNVVAAKYGMDSVGEECGASLHSNNLQFRSAAQECVLVVDLTHGRVASAFSGLRRALETEAARGVSNVGFDLAYRLNEAEVDAAYFGHKTEATRVIDEIASKIPLVNAPATQELMPPLVVEAYGYAERPDRARAYFDRWLAALDTAHRRLHSSEIHASLGRIALAERKYDVAARELLASDTLYDGQPTECATCIGPELGAAYDLAGKHDQAIATFEKYLATPYTSRWKTTDPIFLAGIYKRLGELYEEKNDLARAAQNYRKFIALWKDADPGLQPRVRDARARLALVEKRLGANR